MAISKRGAKKQQQSAGTPVTALERVQAAARELDPEKPDPRALAEFRALLGAHPEVWHRYGDMARLAAESTLNHYKLTLLTESHKLQMEALREELGFAGASPLERLLIEQVVLCWLRVGEAEFLYSCLMGGSHSVASAQSAYAERRLSATQRRYREAVVALERVRRLMRPDPRCARRGVRRIQAVTLD